MKNKHITWLVIGLLLVDQIVKIWIKTNMTIGESFTVIPNLFDIAFTENVGAAFGMSLGGSLGKLALSLFRIVAVSAIGYYIYYLNTKKNAPKGVVVAMSFIFAGALGNIIDSLFYGVFFTESTMREVAHFTMGGGYAPMLQGKVVDMFLFTTKIDLPQWLGGKENFTIFPYIFNVADSYISCAVIYLLLFKRSFFK